jgi:hypothetical protein
VTLRRSKRPKAAGFRVRPGMADRGHYFADINGYEELTIKEGNDD